MDHGGEARTRVGEVVAGKYHLERLLGSGGMGAVYAAMHAFTQRRVAVKLMHPNIARSKVAAERFLREARAPGSIGHPGIVEVLDGGYDEDGSLYLVMEILEGETLGAAMRDRRLHLQEISAIVLELLEILAAAHEAGFVHRDIKPENIFLALEGDDEIDVKLLDFGVAGVMPGVMHGGLDGDAKITRAGAVLGTPLYMSPEQALGRAIDSRSDLWSVGALLYQALAGIPPYNGDGFQALVVSISTHEHTPLGALRPDLPPRLHAVVERALRKDPNKRWTNAREMADALQAAVEGRSTAHGAGTLPVESMPTVTRMDQAIGAGARAGAARGDAAGPSLMRIAWMGMAAVLILGAIGYALTIGRGAAGRSASQTESEVAREAAELAQASADLDAHNEARKIALAAAAAEPGVKPAQAKPSLAPSQPERAQPERAQPEPAQPAPTQPEAAQTQLAQKAPTAPASPPRGLSSDALEAVLTRGQDELQHCYQQEMVAVLTRGGPALAALSLDVSLAITKQGAVAHADVTGDAPASLRECVASKVRAFAFPAADAESNARFPIVFQPSVVGQ